MSSIAVRTGLMLGALTDVVIDVLTVADGVGMSADAVIVLEFAVTVPYTEDIPVAVLIDASAGLLFVIVIEVVTDVRYVNVLAGVVKGLEFAVAVPFEDSMPFCRAPFSCSTMSLLDCDCVLQARMPSYHV